jgi:hypothetical protein
MKITNTTYEVSKMYVHKSIPMGCIPMRFRCVPVRRIPMREVKRVGVTNS